MTESKTGNLRPPIFKSLSARLLVLTIFFVMLAEFLIYAPSIARFRKVFLESAITKAHLATMTLDAVPDNMVSRDIERELLFYSGAYEIIIKHPGRSPRIIRDAIPQPVDATYDLRQGTPMIWMRDAFDALTQKKGRLLRIIGEAPRDTSSIIEIVIDETPMRNAMYDYSVRIIGLSIVISLITAGLVFLSLQWLIVRPMGRITRNMASFREDPEDTMKTLPPQDRTDEIGIAQRELAVMQNELRAALRQKTRLAALGAAVAKINHDLRNSLSTAVLASDRLTNIDDPEVKKLAPRLYKAIDRAITLCSHTLDYAGDGSLKLFPTLFHLHELVAEAGAAMAAPELSHSPGWDNRVSMDMDLTADREQLFRAFINLGKNAAQAGAKNIRINAEKNETSVIISISDDGQGLSAKARKNLFQPFAGSTRDGGSGLGLAIVSDIMEAHGGRIMLVKSNAKGTTFRLELPDRPAK